MKEEIASVKLRLISGSIDILIYLSITLTLIFSIVYSQNTFELFNRILTFIIIWVFVWPIVLCIVNSLLVSTVGGTIGKIITSTEVVGKNGKRISIRMAFFRNAIGHTVSLIFLGLGFLWIFKDKERRTWHDMMAQTKVIKKSNDGLIYGMIALVLLLILNSILVFNIFSIVSNPYSTIRLLISA